jgi:peptidoglycan hydrolase CwlO-like protein|tara:strand:- start:1604 stop:1798 length:195 start_codon:yes stop_codon:yes gene_type:complete
MSEWENQYSQICKTLDEIKSEVKENRSEVMKLKQEMATGKGAIRTAIFIGSVLGAIYTFFKLMD